MSATVIFVLYMSSAAGWEQKLNIQVHPDNCVNYQRQAIQDAKEAKENVIAICEHYADDTMRSDRVIQLSGEGQPLPRIPMLHFDRDATKLCVGTDVSSHCAQEFSNQGG